MDSIYSSMKCRRADMFKPEFDAARPQKQIAITAEAIDALARLYQWAWNGRHNVAITLANARLHEAGLDVPREHGEVQFVVTQDRSGHAGGAGDEDCKA